MRLTIGNTAYKLNTFAMSVIRQRPLIDENPYSILAAYACLKSSLQLISNRSILDNEIFSYSEHKIENIQTLCFNSNNSFGIEILTTGSIKDSTPILIFIAVDEQANMFIIEQASLDTMLSRRSIETLFNSTLSAFKITSNVSDSYYAEVNNILISKQPQSMIEIYRQLTAEIKNRVAQSLIQMSFFDNKNCLSTEDSLSIDDKYSMDIFKSFEIAYPLLALKKDSLCKIYKCLAQIKPKEAISFSVLSIDQALICEMISAALCHQINWDFLRSVILKKTLAEPNWTRPLNLATIRVETIDALLSGYEKADRIRAQERTELLRILGTNFAHLPKGFIEIFFDEVGLPKSAEDIRNELISCPVFSNDPVEKKLQLLLQKLSTYEGFEVVGNHCKPTIDYHIIRSFLRRGFLVPKTKRAAEIITGDRIREEKTVGAIREHCANIIKLLSELTNQSIATINNIEWWIGRTICSDENPDCQLKTIESKWLSNNFANCPFKDFCNSDSITLTAPKYSGNSY